MIWTHQLKDCQNGLKMIQLNASQKIYVSKLKIKV